MERKLFKEVWIMRFEKMLRLEEESILVYEDFLKNKKLSKEDEKQVKALMIDEKNHAKLVKELIKIVKQQED